MRRSLLTLSVVALVVSLAVRGARAADDDDPMVGGTGKKVSEFAKVLGEDKNPKRRMSALVVLEIAGPRPRVVLPSICKTLLSDEDAEVRVAAAQTLERMYPKADEAKLDLREVIESLRTALAGDKADKDERVREAAARALGQAARVQPIDARRAVPELVAALKDKPSIQKEAAASLDLLGPDADKALPDMAELFKDKTADPYARSSAAAFLGRIGSPDDAVILMTEVLTKEPDANVRVRRAALEVLGRCGRTAQSAAPLLARCLKDKDAEVRIAAAAALAQIGPDAKIALAGLREALKDENKFVRCQAMEALGRLGSDAVEAIPDLIEALKTEKVLDARVAAIKALGELGPLAKDAVGPLSDAAKSTQTAVRDAANDALKKIQ
jgi:HEAT repeat protein